MSFIQYNTEDSVISSEVIVRGAWTGNAKNLTNFYTPDLDNGTAYKLDVYNSTEASNLQFSIQYAHQTGSGYTLINSEVTASTPSRVNYGQYRSLIYNDENSSFNLGGVTSPNFFAISVARSCFKESFKPGSLTLKLSGSTHILLTDDSVVSGSLTNFIGSNRYYNLISGSAGSAATTPLNGISGSYGLVFPDLGILLLNAKALSVPTNAGGIGLSISSGTNGGNSSGLFTAIVSGSLFSLQSQETVSSRYFFTRVKNNDFNYTTNPSIMNESGSLLYDTLIDNPQTYVTTVGMYNTNNELLAVAKLSRPLVKDFTKEALIRIKLDY
jgi:hypothetical protein